MHYGSCVHLTSTFAKVRISYQSQMAGGLGGGGDGWLSWPIEIGLGLGAVFGSGPVS